MSWPSSRVSFIELSRGEIVSDVTDCDHDNPAPTHEQMFGQMRRISRIDLEGIVLIEGFRVKSVQMAWYNVPPMELTRVLIADAAAVHGGKLYIHGGGWDAVQANAVPVTHPSLALAFVLRVEYSEALTDIPIVIELLDDDEKAAGAKIEGKIRVGHPAIAQPGNPVFVPQAVTFNMLQFTKYGTYRFRISSGATTIGEAPFRVMEPLSAGVAQGSS
jgi:hypothetical protein